MTILSPWRWPKRERSPWSFRHSRKDRGRKRSEPLGLLLGSICAQTIPLSTTDGDEWHGTTFLIRNARNRDQPRKLSSSEWVPAAKGRADIQSSLELFRHR